MRGGWLCFSGFPFARPTSFRSRSGSTWGGAKTKDSLGRIWLRDGPGSGDPLDIRPDDLSARNWIENWNVAPNATIPESLENLGYDPNHPGDAYIFSTIRWDNGGDASDFRMDLPVPNGDYQVNLYFNEGCYKNRNFKIELQGDIVDEDVSYLDGDPSQVDPDLGNVWKLSFPARVGNEIL